MSKLSWVRIPAPNKRGRGWPIKNYQNRLLVNFYENLFVDILRQSTSCNLETTFSIMHFSYLERHSVFSHYLHLYVPIPTSIPNNTYIYTSKYLHQHLYLYLPIPTTTLTSILTCTFIYINPYSDLFCFFFSLSHYSILNMCKFRR